MPAETDFATVMIEIAKTRVRTPHLYLALLAFAVVLLRVLSLGQDHSWDLFNYHLYGPAALLNGRWMTDVAPAQLQGFHNPLADLPLWWLVSRGAPGGLVSAWLAVPALIAVYCALRTLHWLEVSRTALVSVALLLVTGAAASGTLATSSNDWWLAAASLFAIDRVIRVPGGRIGAAAWASAGLALGLASGLKLTGLLYCVGLVTAALVSSAPRLALQRALICGLAIVGGLVITHGWWSWWLWQTFHNPLFPYFNQLLQSPWAQTVDFSDRRYVPPHGYDMLAAVWRIARGGAAHSELYLRDPRLLLGLLVALISLTRWRHWESKLSLSVRLMLAFALSSLLLWLFKFGIYRYLVALELLACMAMCLALDRLTPRRHWWVWLLTLLIMAAATKTASWGRQDFSAPMVTFEPAPIESDALVISVGDHPVGAAVAFLPESVPALSPLNNFLSPDRCDGLQAQAQTAMRQHQGPVYWLRPSAAKDTDQRWLERLGWSVSSSCRPWNNSLMNLEFCPLRRQQPAEAALHCDPATAGIKLDN